MVQPQAAYYGVKLRGDAEGRGPLIWRTTLTGQAVELHAEPFRGFRQLLQTRRLDFLPREPEL